MKLVRDTRLLFTRGTMATLRNPVWVVMGLFQPVCYMLLFAPLLDGVASTPGFPSGGGLGFFTPGVLVMLGTLSAAFTGFGLISDLRAGVIERFRVTPVHRLALPLGSALRDVTVLMVQSVLVLLVALPLGLRASPGGIAVSLALITLIGLLMASCSYALALTLKDENALASLVNFFFLPLLLLSGIFLPLALAPDWLRMAAALNPFSYAVDATRALFDGDFGDPSVIYGFGIMATLTLLALLWAARSFRRATA